ncbi:S1C family serine protease [Limnoglobus roseus]|uniref:Serine protease n=1 Tax=Limnoglobus roseus TaxID=2598579 RepID=A0A5C1ALU9_9BACT|nr:serine protease [Limnoglobus roseus]QEL19545.1 serine protease [Limnoglobus roseus]
MYRLVLAVVTFGIVSPAFAQNSLKEEELLRIKAATVFIKVGAARVRATGSGFLVKVEGETGYLVTNDHVIDLSFGGDEMPGESAKKSTPVSVVFDSGTAKEREIKASIVAADPERDLAVLKVEKVKGLPTPLDISNPPKLFETMPVFVCGFPFGSGLAAGNKNPEISIGGSTISSIRTEAGATDISSVQINGALNPGNSGGPVVTSDGKLVGVAVKTVRGAGIGIAIPQHEVAAVMRGRVGRLLLLPTKMDAEAKGDIPAKLEVGIIDPLKNVKSITAHFLPGGKPLPKTPEPPGPIPDAMKLPLKLVDDQGTAEVTLPDGGKKGLIVQLELEVAEGKIFTNAIAVAVGPTGPGALGRPAPSDPNGPQRTPDGKLKLASGILLPFPRSPVMFPTPSNSESVSIVNAAPAPFVGKTIRLDAISGCVINPTDKNEFELMVETDSENVPSELRVVLPKDLALQVADLGIPELITVVIQIKFPVRVVGKLAKPVGREHRYTLTADSIEFLDEEGKAVTTLKPESNLPAGKPTLATVNRFPDKFVGQTLTFDALVKGTRYSGGTGIDLGTLNLASPLNLEVYTSRSLATQVESDIAKADLPARVRVTVEVKAINGKTQKGVVGVKQLDVLGDGDKVNKSLKTTASVEYPAIPAPPKPSAVPAPAKVEEKISQVAPPAKPAEGNSSMLIVALVAAVVLVLGGGVVLWMAMRKSKAVAEEGDEEAEEPARAKPVAKKPVPPPVAKRPAKPAPRDKGRETPPPAEDNPFASFE